MTFQNWGTWWPIYSFYLNYVSFVLAERFQSVRFSVGYLYTINCQHLLYKITERKQKIVKKKKKKHT